MRASQKTERMHLPRDTTEAWLESQEPRGGGARHRAPPEDTMEAWLDRRVFEALKGRRSSV